MLKYLVEFAQQHYLIAIVISAIKLALSINFIFFIIKKIKKIYAKKKIAKENNIVTGIAPEK